MEYKAKFGFGLTSFYFVVASRRFLLPLPSLFQTSGGGQNAAGIYKNDSTEQGMEQR